MIHLWGVGFSGIPFFAGENFGFEQALSLAGIYEYSSKNE